jgi:hypothetical protein
MTGEVEFVFNGPGTARATVVLAHGAGAALDTPFMAAMAEGLAAGGLRVARFEFPYMAQRRQSGKRRPPDREPVLRQTWLNVIERLGAENLVIGGKSMGGRIASLIADDAGVAGLVCLGYPFHPAGQPSKLRTEHLRTLKTPALIVQGERDALGTRDDVAGYELSRAIRLHWLPDGDHSFKPRKASGRTERQNWGEGVAAIIQFVHGLPSDHHG